MELLLSYNFAPGWGHRGPKEVQIAAFFKVLKRYSRPESYPKRSFLLEAVLASKSEDEVGRDEGDREAGGGELSELSIEE